MFVWSTNCLYHGRHLQCLIHTWVVVVHQTMCQLKYSVYTVYVCKLGHSENLHGVKRNGVCVCVCVYIYIYIYIYRERERERVRIFSAEQLHRKCIYEQYPQK